MAPDLSFWGELKTTVVNKLCHGYYIFHVHSLLEDLY